MKVLQINCVYGKGSTGTLTRDLHRMLPTEGIESRVIYGRGEKTEDFGADRMGGELYGKANALRSRLTGIPYGGCEWITRRIIAELRKEKPDVVHLQCINGNFVNIYRLASFLKQEKIPTVLTLHAEFMYTANCSHAYDCEKWKTGCGGCPDPKKANHAWFADRTAESWRRMKEAFSGFEELTAVAVSPWQAERARKSPILEDAEIRVILNGVDTEVFCPEAGKRNREGTVNVLYVTPAFDQRVGHVKGGEFIAPLARRLGQRARILVVGPGEGRELPENVKLLGPVWDQKKLARLYAEADVTLLTSRRETFSMVAAESLCCGTPVVGFRAGGPESIALKEYSRFCEPGDLDALAEAIPETGELDPREIGEAAATIYRKERMFQEYLEVYRKVRSISHESF